jgi:hypothetical protein
MRRAVELWNAGEPALAQFHLIFAGLPTCGDEGAQLRAFIAEKMLQAGVSPDVLLKAQGVDPASLAAFDSPLEKVNYNPAEPRDERGWWSGGGVEEAAWRGKNRLKPIIDFLELLGTRARRWGAEEQRPHEAEPARPKPEPAQPKPEVSAPATDEGADLELPEGDSNKLHHIFDDPKHQLDGLVAHFGSREAALQAIEEATRKALLGRNISGQYVETVQVGQYSLTVKGRVMGGKLKIGTAYIPWKR